MAAAGADANGQPTKIETQRLQRICSSATSAPQSPTSAGSADITYLSTWQAPVYLAFVLDSLLAPREGWSMRTDLKSELVLDALNMAIDNRRPGVRLVHPFRPGE